MTTDDKTPDPTPALLPPSRLAEIRAIATSAPADLYAEPDPGATCDECGEHCGERGVILRTPGGGGALLVLSDDNDAATVAFHRDARAMVLVLLAHLDALTPRAPVDGEALGLRLYRILYPHAHDMSPELWSRMQEDGKARYETGAAALHAAGRSEGEAERAELVEEHEQAMDAARASTKRDTRMLLEMRAENARLTAELAEARAEAERATEEREEGSDEYERAQASAEAEIVMWQGKVAAARLDGAREGDATGRREEREVIANELRANGWDAAADLIMDPTEDIRAALARERADGAREERRLCLFDVRRAMGGEDAGANDALAEAERAILGRGDPGLARATEGRQGS